MQRVVCILFAIVLALGAAGCAPSRDAPNGSDIVFIVAGVGGGSGYGGVVDAVANERRSVKVIAWGAPQPFIVVNFSTKWIHDDAEKNLADQIARWRQEHPTGKIDLIGHSAGGGVVLGALARLSSDVHVRNVVLLAPSVSPIYDLNPALAHVEGKVDVFHSDRDTMFLDWRTSNFGTYDRVRSKAAGNTGFTGNYPPGKVVQHSYDPVWEPLGYDGGHFSIIAGDFARKVIAPLLE